MNDPLTALQKAVYETLHNDKGLSNAITGVFDHVPSNTDYPYIVIRQGSIKDWSTSSTTGYEIEVDVMTFSRQRGSMAALEISQRVHALLNKANLVLEGSHTLVDLRYKDGGIKLGKDGLTYVETSSFLAFVEAAAV